MAPLRDEGASRIFAGRTKGSVAKRAAKTHGGRVARREGGCVRVWVCQVGCESQLPEHGEFGVRGEADGANLQVMGSDLPARAAIFGGAGRNWKRGHGQASIGWRPGKK